MAGVGQPAARVGVNEIFFGSNLVTIIEQGVTTNYVQNFKKNNRFIYCNFGTDPAIPYPCTCYDHFNVYG